MLTADSFVSTTGRSTTLLGAEVVARGAVAASIRAEHSQLALVDDAVAIVFAPAGRLQVVLVLSANAVHKITAIDVIADPDRLRTLRFSLLPD